MAYIDPSFNDTVAHYLTHHPEFVLMTHDLIIQYGVCVMLLSSMIAFVSGAVWMSRRLRKRQAAKV